MAFKDEQVRPDPFEGEFGFEEIDELASIDEEVDGITDAEIEGRLRDFMDRASGPLCDDWSLRMPSFGVAVNVRDADASGWSLPPALVEMRSDTARIRSEAELLRTEALRLRVNAVSRCLQSMRLLAEAEDRLVEARRAAADILTDARERACADAEGILGGARAYVLRLLGVVERADLSGRSGGVQVIILDACRSGSSALDFSWALSGPREDEEPPAAPENEPDDLDVRVSDLLAKLKSLTADGDADSERPDCVRC